MCVWREEEASSYICMHVAPMTPLLLYDFVRPARVLPNVCSSVSRCTLWLSFLWNSLLHDATSWTYLFRWFSHHNGRSPYFFAWLFDGSPGLRFSARQRLLLLPTASRRTPGPVRLLCNGHPKSCRRGIKLTTHFHCTETGMRVAIPPLRKRQHICFVKHRGNFPSDLSVFQQLTCVKWCRRHWIGNLCCMTLNAYSVVFLKFMSTVLQLIVKHV
jgi:hypothetical protein